MARGFDLSITLSVSDTAVALAALKAAKNPGYCHNKLLARLIEVGTATAQDLAAWYTNEAPADEQWKKYSAGCHMAYFLNRFRGAVQGAKADGTVVVGKARAKKAKAEVKAEEAPEVEADVAEAVEA